MKRPLTGRASVGVPAGLDLLKVVRPRRPPRTPPTAPSVDVKTRDRARHGAPRIVEPEILRDERLRLVPSPEHRRFRCGRSASQGPARRSRRRQSTASRCSPAARPQACCMSAWTSACRKSSRRLSPRLRRWATPANRATDALVADIAASQLADGSWPLVGGIGSRPPAEEGAHHPHRAVRAIAEGLRSAGTRR